MLQLGSGHVHLPSRKDTFGSLSHPGIISPCTSLRGISRDILGHDVVFLRSAGDRIGVGRGMKVTSGSNLPCAIIACVFTLPRSMNFLFRSLLPSRVDKERISGCAYPRHRGRSSRDVFRCLDQ